VEVICTATQSKPVANMVPGDQLPQFTVAPEDDTDERPPVTRELNGVTYTNGATVNRPVGNVIVELTDAPAATAPIVPVPCATAYGALAKPPATVAGCEMFPATIEVAFAATATYPRTNEFDGAADTTGEAAGVPVTTPNTT
jgi:hypothetical protein